MASSQILPARQENPFEIKIRTGVNRPHTLRTHSESDTGQTAEETPQTLKRSRHKSTATPSKLARLAVKPTSKPLSPVSAEANSPITPRTSIDGDPVRSPSTLSPLTSSERLRSTSISSVVVDDTTYFDSTKADYELQHARKFGSGLWSDVFLAEPVSPRSSHQVDQPTPPETPPRPSPRRYAPVFAVKVPARRDAKDVLKHEAKVLTDLQTRSGANQYIVPFFGLDIRNGALVFEAVLGGPMSDLINRLKHMTEVTRHQELVSVFPGIANDLVVGLEFIHGAGIVHADIKPANILLDVSDHYSLPAPVIRARYIDFSASFTAAQEEYPANAGGTWEYMAPEQMRPQKDLNTPTFASDTWSLGISLLAIIVLGSPYAAACGDNLFMLREAIKSGEPMGFARMDPKAKKRMDACQGFVDCCKIALQKDRERRGSTTTWRRWLESHQDDEYAAFVS